MVLFVRYRSSVIGVLDKAMCPWPRQLPQLLVTSVTSVTSVICETSSVTRNWYD